MKTTVSMTLAVLLIGVVAASAAEPVKPAATVGNVAISMSDLDAAIGARLNR